MFPPCCCLATAVGSNPEGGPCWWWRSWEVVLAANLLLFVSTGLTTEGLYRVSGNKTDQDNIQKLFDQGEAHLSWRPAEAASRLRLRWRSDL